MNSGVTDRGIYYEVLSAELKAPPLVMVMGYAGSTKAWPQDFLIRLSKSHPVVVFDNRGTGRSLKPKAPSDYSIELMADDLASVTNELGFHRFHLFGYSLGGCIALEFAHQHPERLQSLFLLSTTAGGAAYVSPGETILNRLQSPEGKTLEELNRWTWEICMSPKSVDHHWKQLRQTMVEEKEHLTPRSALRGHLAAYQNFDRAKEIEFSFPVSVVSGDRDPLTPADNSTRLHQLIQKSALHFIEDCEHMPMIEKPAELEALIRKLISP